MRPSFVMLPLVFCAINALADDGRMERVKSRLVERIHDARDRTAEEKLVERGLSMQDAQRIVHGLVNGVADCLLTDLSQSSEGTSDSDRLGAVEQSLDEHPVDVVLLDLIAMTGEDADVCALNEMQQAGITIDVVPTGDHNRR